MITRRSLITALASLPALPTLPGLGAGAAAAAGQTPAPDLATVPRIALAQFKALHATKSVLAIDVRDPHSFDAGHIPGAMNVSFVDVEISANRLLKEKRPIVAYCA